ncbi:hypothetical protein BN2475_50240 [Paraburkholderia ribeironis]|uniref:Uncharacterized protein n=1 Tax=Paraburkholderia ribeironis TaxID=1247936 RepID=A0A1N7RL86_9BURK|nr:hypothetical protein BN2475_50240 [Paraburkholderia ribeironis]
MCFHADGRPIQCRFNPVELIDPHLQQSMAQTIDAKVTRVNASHVAMISQPRAVADAIIVAARAAR